MGKLAQDVMTANPACCTPETPIDQVAQLMVQHDCGEIPVIDPAEQVIGVVTDRDIVCRIVADGKNPLGHTAAEAMTAPPVTVPAAAPLSDVAAVMKTHRIRRVLVVDDEGGCTGIVALADVAVTSPRQQAAELPRELSRRTDTPHE